MMSPSTPSASSSSPTAAAATAGSGGVDPDLAEIGHYVVTAHPPGAVTSSIKCSFLSDNSTDVIIAKSNRLEIRQFQQQQQSSSSLSAATDGANNSNTTDENLFPLLLTLPINGRVQTIAPIRFPNAKRDCLFLTTEKGCYSLISYDETLMMAGGAGSLVNSNNAANAANAPSSSSQSNNNNMIPTGEHYPIQTHATGSFKSYSSQNNNNIMTGGRIAECGPLLAIDPLLRCIAIHAYDCYLTIIPINRGYDGVGVGFRRVPWRRNGPGVGAANSTVTAAGIAGDTTAAAAAATSSLAGGSGKPAAKPNIKPRGLSASTSTPFGDPFHLRIDERTLLSMTFLEPPSPPSSSFSQNKCPYLPQIALLHQDCYDYQHVLSHGIDLIKKKLIPNGNGNSSNANNNNNPRYDSSNKKKKTMQGGNNTMPPPGEQLRISKVEGGSSCLIAVPPPPPSCSRKVDNSSMMMEGKKNSSGGASSKQPHGGVIILGQKQITYHSTAEGITRVRPTGGALLLSYCRVVESSSQFFSQNGPNDGDEQHQHILRYLMGDDRGRIHLLSLIRKENGMVTTMLFDTLGTVASSSSLLYLGKGTIFVGSQFGNSQLVKILDTPVPTSSTSTSTTGGGMLLGDDSKKGGSTLLEDTTHLQVMEEYTNLGPIVDFDLRPCSSSDDNNNESTSPEEAEVQGNSGGNNNNNNYRQSVIATCSGVAKDGTVRLVRNGVGMREHAAVEMEGIKGMWALRRKLEDGDDAFLVQSFVRETRMLGVMQSVKEVEMDDEEDRGSGGMQEEEEEEEEGGALAEVTIPGFNSSKSTLYAGNLKVGGGGDDLLLQVVDDGVRLVDSKTLALVASWSPFSAAAKDDDSDDDDEPMGFITVASANESGQIVVALRGGALVYLLVEGGGGGGSSPTIRRVKRVTLGREISCVDLNPFGSQSSIMSDGGKDGNAMDETNNDAQTRKSQLVAVGLWDDFSVRLLNLGDYDGPSSSVLDQVLCINLGRGNNNGSGGGSQLAMKDTDHGDEQLGESGQHMMARSLCLVTMDSQSTNSNSIMSSSPTAPAGNSVDMLLVGLGDGKLISFVVNPPKSSSDQWSVHSRKEVSLGTQGVHLIPFQHGSSSESTSSGSCVLATGDRPTVVYLTGGNAGSNSNPKLNYSTISLTVDDDDDEDEGDDGQHASHKNISVNVATPFRSSLLFSSANAHSSSLCVADENTLRLGVIDDIQKLHVTSYKLGMTPRRIAYHEAGRVYCVGCISGLENGGEANQNNCVRFFDDSTFEELSCIHLEPFEMILTIESVSLSINSPPRDGDSRGRFKPTDNTSPVEYRPFIVMGTAYAYPDEDEPSQGRVIVVECNSGASGNLKSDSEDQMVRHVRQVVDLPLMGGIYSIAPFYDGNILVTCGSKTVLCQLAASVVTPGELLLNHIGTPHHGHLISLYVKSLANSDKSLQKCQEKKQFAIVGDLMRSIALVEYYPKHQLVEELARDFNSNYCTEVTMLTNNIYMGSEGFNNLFVLQYNPNAKFEQARCRLDTVGQYHLGEMTNKMIGGSLIMPSNNTAGVPGATANGKLSPVKTSYESNRKVDITIGSQTLYGTVDGTIGSILGLGGKTFAFLNALQRAMDAIVRPVGDLSRGHYRAWEQEQKKHGSCGFIDGDWIETFLDLNRPTMERVVKVMNGDKKWKIRDDGKGFSARDDSQQNLMDTDDGMGTDGPASSNASTTLSVEDVLGAVEEMSMLH